MDLLVPGGQEASRLAVVDAGGILREIALLGKGIQAGEERQPLIGHQRHDMAFALDGPEFEGQTSAQCARPPAQHNAAFTPYDAMSSWSLGDGKVKRRALAGLGLDPDLPPMPLDNLLANSEPDAGAGIGLARVQSLEDLEDALEILRI